MSAVDIFEKCIYEKLMKKKFDKMQKLLKIFITFLCMNLITFEAKKIDLPIGNLYYFI